VRNVWRILQLDGQRLIEIRMTGILAKTKKGARKRAAAVKKTELTQAADRLEAPKASYSAHTTLSEEAGKLDAAGKSGGGVCAARSSESVTGMKAMGLFAGGFVLFERGLGVF